MKGQQAHDDHGREHPTEYQQLLGFDGLVGGGHHPDIAGSEAQLRERDRIGGAPLLDLCHRPLDGASAVVGEEHQDWHDVAVLVQQSGAGLDITRRLRELSLLARDTAPLETALVPTGDRDLRDEGQRDNVLYADDVAHVPAEAIDPGHELVADTDWLLCVRYCREQVDADAELGGDDVVVTVVARAGPQLGHAGLGVPDRGLAPLPPAEYAEHRRQHDDSERRTAPSDARQTMPHPREPALAARHPVVVAGIEV